MPSASPESVSPNTIMQIKPNDIFDTALIYSIKVFLGISLATTYRTITKANIPVYHLPNSRASALISSADIWMICSTPAWRKYTKGICYKMLTPKRLQRFRREHSNCDLLDLFERGCFNPLSLAEIISAADCDLLPCDDDYNFPTWFIAHLLGMIQLPLARKR